MDCFGDRPCLTFCRATDGYKKNVTAEFVAAMCLVIFYSEYDRGRRMKLYLCLGTARSDLMKLITAPTLALDAERHLDRAYSAVTRDRIKRDERSASTQDPPLLFSSPAAK
jgi:hypothetical protein